jgi:hypothetical protein
MSVIWHESSHGVDWRVELDRDRLLPGRLVAGRIGLTAHGTFDAQSLLVALVATEHWKHEVTETDAQGHAQTRVVTSRAEAAREPVAVLDRVLLAPGETREVVFELPVPPLGPATLEADVAGVDWIFEAKLDVPGGFDSRIERPMRVLQPTALLRAGVVPVGEFALYPAADVAAEGVTGSITLEPVPMACGGPFKGRISLRSPGHVELQEIRAELRVRVEATVSGGRHEDIVAWDAILVPGAVLDGERTIEFEGTLADRSLPTIELPHGRTSASFQVILARAWAPDTHLARDVAVSTTTEL